MLSEDFNIKITDINKDNRREILELSLLNLDVFCKVFFPERFTKPFDPPHYAMIEALDDFVINNEGSIIYPNKQIVITASRGLGKSSLMMADKARAILYQLTRFSPWVGYSATHAEEWTENLKVELLMSQARKKLGFGSLKASKYSLTDDEAYESKFSQKAWVAGLTDDDFTTLVLPRGADQQVRGLSYGPYRPDTPLFDDFENSETIENEEQRKKLRSKFFGSFMEIVSQFDSAEYRIVYADTIKHEDALITYLLNDPAWVRVHAPICTESLISLAPRFKSSKAIKIKADERRRIGELDVFAREILCQPISKEAASFKRKYFRYFKMSDESFIERKKFIRYVVIVDPAKTANPTSAESAIFVWGVDCESGTLYQCYAVGERIYPDELYARAIEMATHFGSQYIAIESTGLNEFVMQPLRNAVTASGHNIEVIELKAKKGEGEFAGRQGGKKARIAQMIPYYRKGQVYHNKDNCTALEIQLIGFPRSKRWDLMDAGAYINHILEKMQWYFLSDWDNGDYMYDDEYLDDDMSDDYVIQEYEERLLN